MLLQHQRLFRDCRGTHVLYGIGIASSQQLCEQNFLGMNSADFTPLHPGFSAITHQRE
jgi:hypothetical protein